MNKKRQRLLRAIRRYVLAYECNSWKGGGDPADYPAIEKELRAARKNLHKVVDETITQERWRQWTKRNSKSS